MAVAAPSALDDLRQALGEVSDLQRAAAVLDWDQETCMPPGGVEDRANQLGTLMRLAHERFTSPAMERLLERAAAEVAGMPEDSDEASLVRVVRRDLAEQSRLPSELVAAMARESALARPAWLAARERSEWSRFAPSMETMVGLSRRTAEALGYQDRPYDALLGQTEPGLTTARVEALFLQIRQAVLPLLRAIGTRGLRLDDSPMRQPCPEEGQMRFALDTIQVLGYDLGRGRQDLSAHPFCTSFGPGDVRVTTRVGKTLGDSCLYSSIHEAGHALYEQGIPRSLDRTPLAEGASPGVHESQSRLWENLVGRSRPFAEWLTPRLREAFPATMDGVDPERFWRGVNEVQPTYIRVDADEVTYNLHVLLRFEIECELLEGTLTIAGVPDAWAARLDEYLGLQRPADRLGPLQDIHWTGGLGGFVGYTIGNLVSAQLMQAVRRDLTGLDGQVAAGDFAPLLAWLREHVHRHGRKYTPDELVQRATGEPISADAWIAYVREKFAGLYGIDA